MASASTIADPMSPAGHVKNPPLRLRLKPKGPTTGWVDGGWWPRSRDLAAELPGFLGITLVVVAPETSAQTGHAALMAARHRGNTGDVETLLRSRPPTSQVLDSASTETEAAWQCAMRSSQR